MWSKKKIILNVSNIVCQCGKTNTEYCKVKIVKIKIKKMNYKLKILSWI